MASSFKAATDLKVKTLVRNLITYEAELQENTRNFAIAFDFIANNLKQHTYPDPEYQSIWRSYYGYYPLSLVEKFRINSQTDKGDYLDSLLSRLKTLWKSKDPDALASVLSLLLHLSDSPLQSEVNLEHLPTVGETVKKFIEESKAANILQEDEVWSDVPDWKSSESSSSEELLTPEADDEEMKEAEESEVSADPQAPAPVLLSASPDSVVFGALPEPFALSTYLQPAQVTVRKYARGKVWTEPNALLEAHYEEEQHSMIVLAHGVEVTERALVSDVLCMLLGTESQLFTYEGGYRSRGKMEVTHLTPSALDSLLTQFCKLANSLRRLKAFADKEKSAESMIFRSFAQGVDLFLSRETDLINTLASQVAVQSGVVPESSISNPSTARITLLYLWESLQQTSATSQLLQTVIKFGVTEVDKGEGELSPAYRASYLLSYLYYLLQENVSSTDQQAMHICATLFHTAVHPMVGILCDWMSQGGAIPHLPEFFAQYAAPASPSESLIWESCFGIKTQPLASGSATCCPSFLEDYKELILTLAKTMRVIRKLEEELPAVKKTQGAIYALKETIFQELTQALGVIHSSTYAKKELVEWRPGTERRKGLKEVDFPTIMQREHQSKGLFPNPYLMEIDSPEKPEESKPTASLSTKNYEWVSFSEVIKHAIGEPLKAAHDEAVSRLLSLLGTHLRLEHYFNLIRSIYLMESGEFMTPFLAQIFQRLERDEKLDSAFELNLAFSEVFQGWKWASSFDSFRFVLEGECRPTISLEALSHVQLHFDPPYPLDLVFDKDTLFKYEVLFQFLVLVKRAIHSISDTHWLDKTSRKPYHAFVLFQRELRHFIQSFEVYLFQQILTVASYKFQSVREKAKSVDEVRSLHKAYLEKLIERCLLSQKTMPIYKAVCSVFECCINFRHLVRRLSSISEANPDYEVDIRDCVRVLQDLKEHFKRSNFFLIQILSKQAQRKQAVHRTFHTVTGAYCSLNFNGFYLRDGSY